MIAEAAGTFSQVLGQLEQSAGQAKGKREPLPRGPWRAFLFLDAAI